MNRPRQRTLSLALVILGGVGCVASQEAKIGSIDFYGLVRVTEGEARQALTFKEGDSVALAGDERPSLLAGLA